MTSSIQIDAIKPSGRMSFCRVSLWRMSLCHANYIYSSPRSASRIFIVRLKCIFQSYFFCSNFSKSLTWLIRQISKKTFLILIFSRPVTKSPKVTKRCQLQNKTKKLFFWFFIGGGQVTFRSTCVRLVGFGEQNFLQHTNLTPWK